MKAIDFTVKGEVAGKEFSVKATHKVPASDNENHFLAGVHGQWKARARTCPALLPAERALAFAHKQNQLAVEDLVAKAEMALEANNLDAARKIYEQAQELDPHNAQAKGGLVLVEKMKDRQEDARRHAQGAAPRRRQARGDAPRRKGKRKIVVLAEEDEKEDVQDKDDLAARPARGRQGPRGASPSSRSTAMVNEAIRQANRAGADQPGRGVPRPGADRWPTSTRRTADLAPRPAAPAGPAQPAHADVRRVGDVIERDQAQALALRAAADARLDLRRPTTRPTTAIRERMRVFRNLMDQAREEEAYRQAEAIRLDLINQGLPMPPAVTAGCTIAPGGLPPARAARAEATPPGALAGHHAGGRALARALPRRAARRVPLGRHAPPDHARQYDNWKDYSKDRIAKYSIATFGSDTPGPDVRAARQAEQGDRTSRATTTRR